MQDMVMLIYPDDQHGDRESSNSGLYEALEGLASCAWLAFGVLLSLKILQHDQSSFIPMIVILQICPSVLRRSDIVATKGQQQVPSARSAERYEVELIGAVKAGDGAVYIIHTIPCDRQRTAGGERTCLEMRLQWETPYTLSVSCSSCGWKVVMMNWAGFCASLACLASIFATVVRYCSNSIPYSISRLVLQVTCTNQSCPSCAASCMLLACLASMFATVVRYCSKTATHKASAGRSCRLLAPIKLPLLGRVLHVIGLPGKHLRHSCAVLPH